ncbi:MAG: PaaI family thioesterase [Deltaproteobacteria bacterium]|nr:PaaI family thioesterase [Deltaproteobacteria bacterium]
MTREEKIDIPKPEGHYCFACGTANPIGLNLKFYRMGDAVCTDVTLSRNHVGWENIAHGGIISTVLDEVMSWTILYFKRVFFLTRKMDLKYIRPVLVEIPLTVRGRLLNTEDPKKILAVGEMFNNDGQLLARSKGEFVSLVKEELTSVPESLKKEMFSMIEEMNKEP